MGSEDNSRTAIADQAADWLIRLDAGKADPDAGEAAWPGIDRDQVGPALVRKGRNHRYELFGVAAPQHSVGACDKIVAIEQPHRTGFRRAIDHQPAQAAASDGCVERGEIGPGAASED